MTNGLKGLFASEVVNPTVPGGGSGKCIAALTVRDPAVPVCGSDDPLSVANQTLITAGANVSNQTGTPTQASPIHQVPVLVAPVSVIANLGSAACNGVTINLRSPIIAKIFDGMINNWSDPIIAADNGSISGCLSAAGTIKPVVRSDVSGTTYLFKDYLSKRNPEYIALKQDAPAGSAVVPNTTWLTGTVPGSTIDPRDGNTGVINEVAAVTGAIGYASTAAVGTANVATAAVDSSNPALFFQKPASPLCTTAAATVPPMSTLANWSGVSFTDAAVGYPICGYSFEFIFNNLETAYNGAVTQAQAGVALDLVKYALSPAGQAAATYAANGGFDSIPSAQQTIADEETQTITYSAPPENPQLVIVDTGVGLTPGPDETQYLTYEPPLDQVVAKNESATKLQVDVSVELALYATQSPTGPGVNLLGTSHPVNVDGIPTWLYREEKNKCGPDSAAIAIDTDTLTDHGFYYQETLAPEIGWTESNQSTYYKSVQAVVSRHTNIAYLAETPTSIPELMSWLITDTYNPDPSGNPTMIINDVQPGKFKYWSGYSSPYGHYNLSRGYDERGGGYAQIGDEWDPSYGQGQRPYGFWKVPISDLYAAIHASPAPYEIW